MVASAYPKVLLVGGALGGGGAETRLRHVIKRLFDGTADVAVLRNEHPIALDPRQRLVDLHWAGDLSYPVMWWRLRRAIEGGRYDAILSFGYNANMLAVTATRGLHPCPPVIVTENTRPQTTSTLYFGAARRVVVKAMNRLIYRGADLCAANSQDGAAEIVRHYGAEPGSVRRIPNLVEPERLAALAAADGPVQRRVPASFCAVSRLDALKRIDTLLEAAAGIASSDWRIDLVGDGSERARLAALAERLGIAGRVHFHGWQSNPYPFMARATAVVLCSTLEGFSNTVLEAMALRVPVVTSFCSADAEEMCRRGAALGFPVGDAGALRRQLGRVLADAELRTALAEKAWRYARGHMLPDAIADYETLVQDAIALSRARHPASAAAALKTASNYGAR
jgi:glycosyltransferase involved in cell wall biosynthesis